MRNGKEGFTLVELAIVLVIVGLLIGGILVAQSMSSTAHAIKVLAQAQQYLTASRNFKTNYGYWPADYPRGDFGCAGNGDGTVSFYDHAPHCTLNGYWHLEGANFFVQLSEAGMIPANLSYGNDSNYYWKPGVDAPLGPDKSSAWLVKDVHQAGGYAGTNDFFWGPTTSDQEPIGTSFMFFLKFDPTNQCANSVYPANVISPQEAYFIDAKIDDGMPNTGKVIGSSGCYAAGENPYQTSMVCGKGGGQGPVQYYSTTPYNLDSSKNVCVVGFNLDDY